jgi:hypothetical protein
MWDIDHFPGADKVPWQLLIRARYAHEIDAVVASHVVNTVAGALPRQTAVQFARNATRAVAAGSREPVERETGARALIAFAEFDDWCGTMWPRWPRWPFPFPFPGPWPDPRELDESFILDPITVLTLDRAREFVEAAGSPEFQKNFGAALDEVAGLLGQ